MRKILPVRLRLFAMQECSAHAGLKQTRDFLKYVRSNFDPLIDQCSLISIVPVLSCVFEIELGKRMNYLRAVLKWQKEDPDRTYFVYRFSDDCFAVRCHGTPKCVSSFIYPSVSDFETELSVRALAIRMQIERLKVCPASF